MIEISALIAKYKDWLKKTGNEDELYKWETTKHFQDAWDDSSDDFAAMLKLALSKAKNLLYPNAWAYINIAARYFPAEVKQLFMDLYNEDKALRDRLQAFTNGAEALRPQLEAATGKKFRSLQDERTIAFYLAMRYPARYCLYKFSYYRLSCEALGEPMAPSWEKYPHFLAIVERIKQDYVTKETELLELHRKTLTPSCYQGDDLNLIVQNLLYVSLERLAQAAEVSINPSATWWLYAPGEGAKYWEEYFDEGIMGLGWHELGDLTQYSDQETIADQLKQIFDKPDHNYRNNSRACWEFAQVIKPGDVVIAKRGSAEYIGLGIVESGYRYEAERSDQPNLRSVRWLKRGHWEEPTGPIVLKTLTNISQYPEYVQSLRELILEGKTPAPVPIKTANRPRNYILYGPPGTGKTWSTVEFAVALIEGRRLDAVSGLSREEQRRRYAAAVQAGYIEFITFHQSYSYEDFVEGIRPTTVKGAISYDVQPGTFRRLCDTARAQPGQAHVLIIDEINRGNVARVFGELITLIEDDKRAGAAEAADCQLPYSKAKFTVPANLYIVGTMNTADRSVEALDTALRRRFSFVEIMSQPDLLADNEFALPDLELPSLLAAINRRLERLLDRDHQIGHAYFMGLAGADDPLEALRTVFRDRILPLLKEYFYADPGKVGLVLGKGFVELTEKSYPFADFDQELADRQAHKRSYQFTNPASWTMQHFINIYANTED